ncbi:putative acetyltransferase [Streptomyces sp. Tu6071]|nr:putative acetyltransferase [Streptomyces sp. Tu6071]
MREDSESRKSPGGRRPDVGRRGRERHEAEAAQDGRAVGARVDLEVPDAACGGDAGARRDRRAVQAAPTPRGERRAAPEPGEVGAGDEFDAGGVEGDGGRRGGG